MGEEPLNCISIIPSANLFNNGSSWPPAIGVAAYARHEELGEDEDDGQYELSQFQNFTLALRAVAPAQTPVNRKEASIQK